MTLSASHEGPTPHEMSMDAPAPARRLRWAAWGLILALFLVRNLPWHLDNYDQAKHAYSSYEMIQRGAWWFQHTPYQDTATKPPLSGWLSAGLYRITGSWPWSWRLPSLIPALLLLAALHREGRGMRAVGGTELVERLEQVRLHRRLAHEHRGRDLGVRQAAGGCLEGLPLLGGELEVGRRHGSG